MKENVLHTSSAMLHSVMCIVLIKLAASVFSLFKALESFILQTDYFYCMVNEVLFTDKDQILENLITMTKHINLLDLPKDIFLFFIKCSLFAV